MNFDFMDDCLFCQIYEKGEGIIYENKYFYSQFDKFPITVGHSEIIPKKHVVSLLDLEPEEWNYLKPAIEQTIRIIEKTNFSKVYRDFLENPINESSKKFLEDSLNSPFLKKMPDSYNHGNNDGEAAGRTIHHLHWHIIPRYFGDMKNPRGGIRHIIEGKGNY